MNATSNESWCLAALLVFLGVLALYGGGSWLILLIPAAILACLVASARGHARSSAVDVQVENRVMRAPSK
ncbi:MAG: hypothetical protein WCA16_13380 [Candidatus Sulfotelmatobacter sp.]